MCSQKDNLTSVWYHVKWGSPGHVARIQAESSAAALSAKRVRNPHGQGGRLREELIDAAGRVLAATPDGAELSLRAVAREAGIAAPSVYLQFDDKSALVRAVVGTYFDELRTAITDAMARDTDPVRRLRNACLAYCTFALDQPGKYRVLFHHIPKDERVLGKFGGPDDRGALAFNTLVDAIQGCIDSGDAPAGDAFQMAQLLWPSMHGYVALIPVRPGFPWRPVDDQIDALLASIVSVPLARLGPGLTSSPAIPAGIADQAPCREPAEVMESNEAKGARDD